MISAKACSLYFLLVVSLFITQGCNTFDEPEPAGNASYIKFIGGAKDETVNRGLQYSDGGFILVGESASFMTQGTDAYVARTDNSGNLLWEKTFGGSGADAFSDVKEVNGELLVFGYVTDTANQRDFLLMRLDAAGSLLDSLTFGNPDIDETGRYLLPGQSGNYTLIGVKGYNETSTDIFTVRLQSDFQVEWQQSYGLLEKFDEIGNVLEAPNGNLIWCGTVSTGSATHSRVVSTSPYGQPVWVVTYGETDAVDESAIMLQKGWGSYYVLLSNSENNSGDITLRFIDKNGEQIGADKTFGDENANQASGLCLTSDGGYAITGTTEAGIENSDVLLVRTNSQGDELWTQTYGGSGIDRGSFVEEDRDQGLAIFSTISFENNTVFGLIKTDSEGNTF
ncbi:hypothetical protein AB9P05_20250 [Roseivirga sp. BDSF3-8]|uniref:hypothetical protein n=1 Tax=Roseivirga sp. BDSF3-8 TaxID=3241598 RepID=UPI0035321DB2